MDLKKFVGHLNEERAAMRVGKEGIEPNGLSLENMKGALSSLVESIVWTDQEGKIQWSNDPFDCLVEQKHKKVLGSKLIDLMPLMQNGHKLPSRLYPVNLLLDGEHQVRELYQWQKPSGKLLDLEVSGVQMDWNRSGKNAFVSFHDITEQKHTEEELREAQLQLIQAVKMESVGGLAAGIAHEVKNPLAVLQMGVDYLANSANGTGEIQAVLRDMKQAIVRADNVIKGLLDFSVSRKLEFVLSDLNPLVNRSLNLVKHELHKKQMTVVTDLAEDLPKICVDRNKMEQVFVNLYMNAIQAVLKGGTMRVKTYQKRLVKIGKVVGRRKTDIFKVGEKVVVAEIEDTGVGIPEANMDRIFDPFFTTKPLEQGTGLGLAVTEKIVQMHKASIDIENKPEGGVRVTLMFKVKGENG
ncbi:MAG: hypothetical protein A3J52_03495 [Omnitrophica bacterium RIFCSPHIGHO2_02_FULL_49_9]|nr:MAG: hypothetical protein A3J52_03495 [Omnitrophica bacterium RIFCSPHIGHO2_02_FULL_49_9]OGW89481.1 MAG: hypothetical protein A3A73_05370 [Omnitrophica bacterium RIFCSPLOWO2_01_FULL_50_24]